MEPSKEAIAVRISRLNRQILGKVTSGICKINKKTVNREALLDALTVLYDECNDDPVKRSDELVRIFVDKYRSTVAELRRTRICISDFELLQTIGRGHYGEVQMVREKHTADIYALKCMKKENVRRRVAGAEDERDVLANSTSQWLPKLQYAFQDANHLYLVMELCSGGDLANLLSRRNHPLPEEDASFYVAEVAHALKSLHGMGYVHRDVKPHNILIDRCGHVKLADLGSSARLSEGSSALPVGTPDYVAPEVLAELHCAQRHSVCSEICRGTVAMAISACDYWSLGVVAFELVTLRRPFSSGEDDTIAQILGNMQKYERDPNAEPPFDPLPSTPSPTWRGLVRGLLRCNPSKRFNYLDTLQHKALAHLSMHNIRDQVPPWVPSLRGDEDGRYFNPEERTTPAAPTTPFRQRLPFDGQLPYVGYSYVAAEDSEDHHASGFSASLDCTAIDLNAVRSAEKIAASRAKEIASLQSKLAASDAATNVEVEKTRRAAESEAERQRARLQAEITALSLQNRRLERQVEVEKEERMALERTNQQLNTSSQERSSAETRLAQAHAAELQVEKENLKDDLRRLESQVSELQAECKRAVASAENAKAQQKHYKDTIAKERALRRQTLSGGEAETREAGARAAAAEANAARETRAREIIEKRLAEVERDNRNLTIERDQTRAELSTVQESISEKQRIADAATEQLKEVQLQLTQEKVKCSSLLAQVKELHNSIQEAGKHEAALEEQCSRTEARLNQRLEEAESRASSALLADQAHRDKVKALEHLVRQLEREVSALETRNCECDKENQPQHSNKQEAPERDSDTESTNDLQVKENDIRLTLLQERVDRADKQLQERGEEIAALRQEARSANLARWRKEREFNELSTEMKSTERNVKRLEERLNYANEARKTAEQKASSLESEVTVLRPQYQQASEELKTLKEKFTRIQKIHDTLQAEVDRSRNDIRKLKSELQYSEKRRLHAEEQEELSSREIVTLRSQNADLVQNNRALQEACSLLEEQLTDLERLSDHHEYKNKDLESELSTVREELMQCRQRLELAERQATDSSSAASAAAARHEDAATRASHAYTQLNVLKERLESREQRISELESRLATCDSDRSTAEAALTSAMRRVRELQEESSALRSRAHQHHTSAMQLQQEVQELQEELAAAREGAAAATSWWRTRETKADATLRQQAKLIDFLQAKIEEAARKKCSLSNKLFGKTTRRPAASPPLRKANRELRDEVGRLRTQLAATATPENMYPTTPRRERIKRELSNRNKGIDEPDSTNETSLQIVWSDGSRERLEARVSDGLLVLTAGDKELRAWLKSNTADNVPQNEASRSFTVEFESPAKEQEACVVCPNLASRAHWIGEICSRVTTGYTAAPLTTLQSLPVTALYQADDSVIFGCTEGFYSLHGHVRVEWDSESCMDDDLEHKSISNLSAVGTRVVFVWGTRTVHVARSHVVSAARRAASLSAVLRVAPVVLPDTAAPHLIQTIVDDPEGASVAVACGRRVFLLKFDAANEEFKIIRSLTVDRSPSAVLLTNKALYIAGEKPLKINLPQGALETFGTDVPIIAAAAKKHSSPKAILLIKENPVEILLCYSECGIFVDVSGRRTRSDDPKWTHAVKQWRFIAPFLYLMSESKITISYIGDEAYRAPPCSCEVTSIASTMSDCCMPEPFTMKVNDGYIVGTTPRGVIIRSIDKSGYKISVVEGLGAFRSIGASVESLDALSDSKSSSSDLGRLSSAGECDTSPQNESQESVELTTGFLADIRKRAQQLKAKNAQERSPDDVIKEILTTEVGLKKASMNKRDSPTSTSEFDSDTTDSDGRIVSAKNSADLCGEMFSRQVRFQ